MDKNYEELANAIIIQAVKDYRQSGSRQRGAIVRFFRSDWFKVLTNLDPEHLIAKLKKEVSAHEC